MNLTELLRMSSSNLRRRKLRTFLTVLGVVIGYSIYRSHGVAWSWHAEIHVSGN